MAIRNTLLLFQIVVDTLQGQMESTVVCCQCSHKSTTYEPFMYLSVPIPHALQKIYSKCLRGLFCCLPSYANEFEMVSRVSAPRLSHLKYDSLKGLHQRSSFCDGFRRPNRSQVMCLTIFCGRKNEYFLILLCSVAIAQSLASCF